MNATRPTRFRWSALLLLLAACARPAPAPAPEDGRAEQIVAALNESAVQWNLGNLEGFLDPYLDSPATTFAGSSGVTRGKDAVRQQYLRSYWASGTPSQALRFTGIEVRPLGPDHALAVGQYVLEDREAAAPPASGWFSLVWVRTAGGWKIIHDHSS